MKKHMLFATIGITIISLTGCYTRIAIEDSADSYTYSEPEPIVIIYYLAPEPILDPAPPSLRIPIVTPREKIRKPVIEEIKNERKRDPLRNSGGRNNITGKKGN